MRTLKILVVDDDDIVCALLRDLLGRQGHQVATYTDPHLALVAAGRETFDLALVDLRMPGMNGIEALRQLRPRLPKARFVMITGSPADELVGEGFAYGALLCLSKPFDPQKVDELLGALFVEETAGAAR